MGNQFRVKPSSVKRIGSLLMCLHHLLQSMFLKENTDIRCAANRFSSRFKALISYLNICISELVNLAATSQGLQREYFSNDFSLQINTAIVVYK